MAFDHRKYKPFKPGVDKRDRRWPDQQLTAAPRWLATDLRDGNQALVKPMTIPQKQKMFDLLVKIGIKEIEVGFPSASQVDFDFVRQLVEENRIPEDVTIQVLTQARPELIERTFESLKGAERAIMHVYNATAPAWRNKVFRVDREGCKQIAIDGVTKVLEESRKYPETDWTFEYSPETFSQTEPDFIVEVLNAVTQVWQPQQGQKVIYNLPSTVEATSPNIYADQLEWVLDRLDHREHLCMSLHPHNDRGCSVAAAELGMLAGGDRVEGTLLGNGERTGNLDLVNVAMNFYSQGIDPKLDLSNMREIVSVVEEVTDIKTNPRHPWAGDLVFAAFSGSHQDAIRKCMNLQEEDAIWDVAYLPIDPKDVGRRYEEVVRVNSQSGKGGVAHILERDFDISLPRWMQQEFAKVVQQEAETTSGEVNAAEIARLFDVHYLAVPEGFKLKGYDVSQQANEVSVAATIVDTEGGEVQLNGKGEGVVSALVNALQEQTGISMAVASYDEFALDQGTEANAMACVKLSTDKGASSAVARSKDTTAGVLQAVLGAAGRFSDVAELVTKAENQVVA